MWLSRRKSIIRWTKEEPRSNRNLMSEDAHFKRGSCFILLERINSNIPTPVFPTNVIFNPGKTKSLARSRLSHNVNHLSSQLQLPFQGASTSSHPLHLITTIPTSHNSPSSPTDSAPYSSTVNSSSSPPTTSASPPHSVDPQCSR